MSQRPIEIVELNRRLSNDPQGIELQRLTEQLSQGKGRVVRDMDRGVGIDEYARLSSLALAFDASIDALPKLWASLQTEPSGV